MSENEEKLAINSVACNRHTQDNDEENIPVTSVSTSSTNFILPVFTPQSQIKLQTNFTNGTSDSTNSSTNCEHESLLRNKHTHASEKVEFAIDNCISNNVHVNSATEVTLTNEEVINEGAILLKKRSSIKNSALTVTVPEITTTNPVLNEENEFSHIILDNCLMDNPFEEFRPPARRQHKVALKPIEPVQRKQTTVPLEPHLTSLHSVKEAVKECAHPRSAVVTVVSNEEMHHTRKEDDECSTTKRRSSLLVRPRRNKTSLGRHAFRRRHFALNLSTSEINTNEQIKTSQSEEETCNMSLHERDILLKRVQSSEECHDHKAKVAKDVEEQEQEEEEEEEEEGEEQEEQELSILHSNLQEHCINGTSPSTSSVSCEVTHINETNQVNDLSGTLQTSQVSVEALPSVASVIIATTAPAAVGVDTTPHTMKQSRKSKLESMEKCTSNIAANEEEIGIDNNCNYNKEEETHICSDSEQEILEEEKQESRSNNLLSRNVNNQKEHKEEEIEWEEKQTNVISLDNATAAQHVELFEEEEICYACGADGKKEVTQAEPDHHNSSNNRKSKISNKDVYITKEDHNRHKELKEEEWEISKKLIDSQISGLKPLLCYVSKRHKFNKCHKVRKSKEELFHSSIVINSDVNHGIEHSLDNMNSLREIKLVGDSKDADLEKSVKVEREYCYRNAHEEECIRQLRVFLCSVLPSPLRHTMLYQYNCDTTLNLLIHNNTELQERERNCLTKHYTPSRFNQTMRKAGKWNNNKKSQMSKRSKGHRLEATKESSIHHTFKHFSCISSPTCSLMTILNHLCEDKMYLYGYWNRFSYSNSLCKQHCNNNTFSKRESVNAESTKSRTEDNNSNNKSKESRLAYTNTEFGTNDECVNERKEQKLMANNSTSTTTHLPKRASVWREIAQYLPEEKVKRKKSRSDETVATDVEPTTFDFAKWPTHSVNVVEETMREVLNHNATHKHAGVVLDEQHRERSENCLQMNESSNQNHIGDGATWGQTSLPSLFMSSDEKERIARYVMSSGKLRHDCPEPFQFLTSRARELRAHYERLLF